MTKVSWLVEAEMFPDYRDELLAQIIQQGHAAKVVPEIPFGYRLNDIGSPHLQMFPPDACVVFHGCIEIANSLSEQSPWVPGVFCNWPNYECSTYYCHLARYLVNADYVLLPFGELQRRKDYLFSSIGKDGCIFVRPNSPQKSFTGQVARSDSFERDVEYMAFYDVPPQAIVLVSSPKQLVKEWRFVVASQTVVAGSRYKSDGKLDKVADSDAGALKLATEIASQAFQPDAVWVMDLCQTDTGDYHLLEIGSFSCAELYACNMTDVVREVSRVAMQEWEAGKPKSG